MDKSRQQFEEWFNENGISAGWCSKRDLEFIKNKTYQCWKASRESLINNLPESINCPTAPELIWLQVDPEPEVINKPEFPVNLRSDDVTWCVDRIHTTDTLYIRADLIQK
ncbi:MULTISPECIES: hypothetical protein [Providencia]|uniref:hypothetical protein n=1 Tax=Providencia TaxID=586 RepID=UPI0008FB36F8|nr:MULTISPECIES: hypothetical protein [Providencia]APC12930.1 hypothetical protein RB151_032720 [Providencia rettgeri]ELR5055057.1 hypothetical protein [Providencia rettgeri]ELR5157440.1 hypothetical protein [Providencia rettgeri]ELR5184420.1 hypothetical protein [Providencia rettgeri]ELR5214531.1 hypothetical protein [Providencia rettgeri]